MKQVNSVKSGKCGRKIYSTCPLCEASVENHLNKSRHRMSCGVVLVLLEDSYVNYGVSPQGARFMVSIRFD